jgi:hypothetical protein
MEVKRASRYHAEREPPRAPDLHEFDLALFWNMHSLCAAPLGALALFLTACGMAGAAESASTDAAGNTTTKSNGAAPYTFVAPQAATVLLMDENICIRS